MENKNKFTKTQREEYFKKLHAQLGYVFKVNTKTINFIRSNAIGGKKTRAEIIVWLEKRVNPYESKYAWFKPKQHFKEALELLKHSTYDDWEILTQKTPYDIEP